MIFRSKKDQALFDKLTDELADLYVSAEILNGKIAWRQRRVNALVRRTRCKKVERCRHEDGHSGAHVI